MTRSEKQKETSSSPKTPKLIKPPCRSSYEAIEDLSNGKSNKKKQQQQQLMATIDTSITNASSPSEMVDKGKVTTVCININLSDIFEAPATTKIPKPQNIDEPIQDFLSLLKKDIDERRAARAARRAKKKAAATASASAVSGSSSTNPNLISVDTEDGYQNLALLKKEMRQRLPEGPSTVAADNVSSIPDDQLTPKKFFFGKKRRDYVVLGDLNKAE